MTELQVLSAIKNRGGSISYTDLLNIGASDNPWEPLTDRELIARLAEDQILSGGQCAYGKISFGKHGRLRLKELEQCEQERSQKAAEEIAGKRAQRHHDWAVAIIGSLAGAVFGVIGTLAVQYLMVMFN